VDTGDVMRWVAAYERAWRENDVAALDTLFTEDARYLLSPYEEPRTGHAAIREIWPEPEGTTFEVTGEPVAVQDDRAVVRVQVNYLTPERQEYRDLWLLTFAPDGRVQSFEEWAFWPGKPYTARP
jgi:ketosteroid isomerase-like protein